MHDTNVTTYRITEGDPLSAEVHVRCMIRARPRRLADPRGDRLAA